MFDSFFDSLACINRDSDKWKIIAAMQNYSLSGKLDQGLSARLNSVFVLIVPLIAKSQKKHGNPNFAVGKPNPYYSKKINNDNLQIIEDNGYLAFNQQQDNSFIESDMKKKNELNKNIKPTLEMIKNYISENKLEVDATEFFDFYESKGWLVGSSPMVDFCAALRGWNKKSKTNVFNRKDSSVGFAERTYNHDELEKLYDDIDKIDL